MTEPKPPALPPIPWSDTWVIGHGEIDADHRGMIEDLNRLSEAIHRRRPKEELAARLRAVCDDALMHFPREEMIMEASRYPGLLQHRVRHLDLLRRIGNAIIDLDSPTLTWHRAVDLASGLRAALIDHLVREDLAYKSHLDEAGALR